MRCYMINNNALQGVHKKAITFFLQKLESSKKDLPITVIDLLQQINSSTVSIENSLYYCIIKFYHNGENYDKYDKILGVQVLHGDAPPTSFNMYLKNNLLCEFEYFNADSSEICEQKMFGEKVLIEVIP